MLLYELLYYAVNMPTVFSDNVIQNWDDNVYLNFHLKYCIHGFNYKY